MMNSTTITIRPEWKHDPSIDTDILQAGEFLVAYMWNERKNYRTLSFEKERFPFIFKTGEEARKWCEDQYEKFIKMLKGE